MPQCWQVGRLVPVALLSFRSSVYRADDALVETGSASAILLRRVSSPMRAADVVLQSRPLMEPKLSGMPRAVSSTHRRHPAVHGGSAGSVADVLSDCCSRLRRTASHESGSEWMRM